MTTRAVLLCGHGSRDGEALAEVAHTADLLAERLPAWRVDHGFLQYARPTIAERLAALADTGARDILALPGMLFAAGHVKADIPAALDTFAGQRPAVRLRMALALADDAGILDAAQARIAQADGAAGRADACLLVAGRGTAEAEANAMVVAAAGALRDRLGFGHAEAAFAGVAEPGVEITLARLATQGFARIVVLPYFLFTGILVKRLAQQIDDAAAHHPGARFIAARHLGSHRRVIDAFAARVHAIDQGGAAVARRAS